MNDLLETYDKNRKKHLLKEVTATGAAGTFTGRGGNYIDQKFAGGFHPEFGELKKTLEKQVDNDIVKRMYTDDVTPFIDPDFIDLEWEYHYDENEEVDKSKFKSTSETEMQLVDIEIKYDKTEENMKYLDTKIKYDKIIDKTEENKKFINPTNDWKVIYDNRER